jgi:hypothetical protein
MLNYCNKMIIRLELSKNEIQHLILQRRLALFCGDITAERLQEKFYFISVNFE